MKRDLAFKASIFSLVIAFANPSGPALAWGDSGHRWIGEAAIAALPKGLPSFLYSQIAIHDVGDYSREPDIWRKSGLVHDSDRDPAHYIKLNDEGATLAGDSLDHLPATRSKYEASLRAKGVDPAETGYLPYSIIDAFEQVSKDFALVRVIKLAMTEEKQSGRRAWLQGAYRRRCDMTLRDIGILSHFVGDSTQPMHLSIHYDGWGPYPNPEGYTTAAIHWPIEANFVRLHIMPAAIRAHMKALFVCPQAVEVCVSQRLTRNFQALVPLYQLEKDGGFRPDDPRGGPFLTGLIAQGASDLRDMIVEAWDRSDKVAIDFSQHSYLDAKSGTIKDLYALIYGDS